jgi:hypothetical protein
MNLSGGLAALGSSLSYIGQQGLKEQEQAKQDQAILDRETAIKRLEIEAKKGDRKAALDDAITLSGVTTNNGIRAHAVEMGLGDKYKAREQTRAAAIAEAQARANFAREINKLQTQHKFSLDEDAYKAGLDAVAEARRDGRKLRVTGVDGKGNITFVDGNNNITTVRGVKPLPHGEDVLGTLLGGGGVGGTAAAGTSTAATDATPPSVQTTSAPSQPDGRFLTTYANADPKRYPALFRNGQKIPVAEAWQMFQGQ